MTDPVPLVATGIQPFDLVAPSRLLVPGPPHQRPGYRTATVDLGDGATIEIARWDRCQRGCRGGGAMASHEAGQSVRLRIADVAYPHCSSCDCLPYREFALPPEKVAELKGILP